MLQDTVVIEGEVSLVSQIDGDPSLLSAVDGDPDVVIAEGMSPTYPHYSGSYTVTPSTSAQVLDTSDKVMDDDVTVQAVPQGSATTPATIITADPTISVSSGGLITAQVSKTQQITPTVVEGYIDQGTAGNVGVSGSNTEQLSAQGAQSIYPSSSDQEIASGKYLTGKQTIKKVVVTGLSADKVLQGTTVKIGDVDDDDRIMSVTGTAQGGITPTGTKQITQNGTTDVTNYASADVNVPNSYSAGDEGKVVSNGALVAQSSDSVTQNGTVDTTLINSLTVNVSGGGGGSVQITIPEETWVNKSINTITGAFSNNTSRLTTARFTDGIAKAKVPTGYQLRLSAWRAGDSSNPNAMTYVGSWTGSAWGTSNIPWFTEIDILAIPNWWEYNYRFAVHKDNDGTITLAEGELVEFTTYTASSAQAQQISANMSQLASVAMILTGESE